MVVIIFVEHDVRAVVFVGPGGGHCLGGQCRYCLG